MLANYLPKDPTYKLSFAFAIILHVTLVVLLVVKFGISRQFALEPSVNIIKAVAINNLPDEKPTPIEKKIPPKEEIKETPKEIQKEVPKSEPPKAQELKIKNDKTLEILQKHLLAEQALEAKTLKKQVATKKMIQQATIQKALQEEMAKEKAALVQMHLNAKAQGEVDRYKALIIQAIANEWIIPENVDENASCKLLVDVAPGGVVLKVQVIESSGNDLLDRSAKTAVSKASPLPVPKDTLFDNFRTIRLTVKPKGIIDE